MIYGSLLDCMVFTPEEFDDRFIVGTFDEPRPLMLKFIKNLIAETITNSQSKEEFDTLMLWAYNKTKFDSTGNTVAFKNQSFESLRKEFLDSNFQYYKYLMDTIIDGKMLISIDEYDKATIANRTLKTNSVTGPIILQETNDEVTVFKQLVIEFEIDGVEFKSMLDLVHVNHAEKKIYFYDLKTTHNAEQFSHSYLKFKYYIQLGVYTEAIYQWRTKNYPDYMSESMMFITIDSYNYMEPLIYRTSSRILADSFNGFFHKGVYYRGISQLIRELKWHKQSDIWSISYENYHNNGYVNLVLDGEDEE